MRPIGDCGGVAAAVNVIEQARAPGDTQVDAEYATLLAQAQLPIALYRTVATWRLLPGRSITFASRAQADVYLRPDLDTLNFAALAVGQELGELSQQPSSCLEVRDESGRVVTDEYLAFACRQADHHSARDTFDAHHKYRRHPQGLHRILYGVGLACHVCRIAHRRATD